MCRVSEQGGGRWGVSKTETCSHTHKMHKVGGGTPTIEFPLELDDSAFRSRRFHKLATNPVAALGSLRSRYTKNVDGPSATLCLEALWLHSGSDFWYRVLTQRIF